MASDHDPIHQSPHEYTFPLPELDVSGDFRTQPRGRFSRLTGIDGRYSGRLKRSPGWRNRVVIPSLDTDGNAFSMSTAGGVSLQKPFAIEQAPRSTSVVRGIVFLAKDVSNFDHIYALYYADNDADGVIEGPFVSKVSSFTDGSVTDIDVTHTQHLLHIVGTVVDASGDDQSFEQIARYCGGTAKWISHDWHTSSIEDRYSPSSSGPGSTLTDYLIGGHEYAVAFRLIFSEQGLQSPIFGPFLASTSSGLIEKHLRQVGFGSTSQIAQSLISTARSVFTRCVVKTFRTISPISSTLSTLRGQLFEESEFEIPRMSFGLNVITLGSITFTGIIGGNAVELAQVSVGDIIYVRSRFDPGGPNEQGFFRRRVIAVNSGAGTLSWDEKVPYVDSTIWVVVSKDRNEVDTSGVFEHAIGPTTGDGETALTWGRATSSGNDTPDFPTNLSDQALVTTKQLTPEDFSSFKKGNPSARRIVSYEQIFIRAGSASKDSPTRDLLRWDFIEPEIRGLVSALNRRALDLDDVLQSLKTTDTFCVAIMRNRLVRIYRSGSRLSVDIIHNQHGTTGRWSSVAIGNNLYMVSPVGALIVELTSGQLDVFNATQHFFSETGRWRNDLDSVQAAYDAEIGAIIFLNPVKAEAIFIWLNNGVLSHFIDVPFDWVMDGLELSAGERRRALFLISGPGGGVYEYDAALLSDTRTTCDAGTGVTYNGLAGAATNATTLAPPGGGTFSADMVGHYVRFFNPTTGAKGARAKITAFSSPNLTFASASPVPASGDRFAIGAIPLTATMWPFSGASEGQLVDIFRDKGLFNAMPFVANMSGDTGASNPNKVMRHQIFTRDENTPTIEAEGAMDDTENAANATSIEQLSTVMVPGFENWSSDLDVDILGVIYEGEIRNTRQDA